MGPISLPICWEEMQKVVRDKKTCNKWEKKKEKEKKDKIK